MIPGQYHTHYCVSDSAIDDCIRQHYPEFKDYSFAEVQESPNDTNYVYLNMEGTIDDWTRATLNEWKAGKFVLYSNFSIMTMLVHDEHLPQGNILVSVSW